jgi:D-aminopeptidase
MLISRMVALLAACSLMLGQESRPRARDLGIRVGVFATGPLNAITDVRGVRVGHATLHEGERIHTGVTAILPHSGNVFRERVPAAIHIANAFGKLVGATQVRELGELETPILLTCTLCVWKAADGLVEWMLTQQGMDDVRSINPVVGETNDGGLNDIRARPINASHVKQAMEAASTGAVEEGSVGAGAGTIAFGWKGGIGTSSRKLPQNYGGYTVGVLVQSNFGGNLTIAGAPVGRELGRVAYREQNGDGSIMIVVATDAPITSRNLERLGARAIVGLARTGSSMSNGSGDFVIAFSTVRGKTDELTNDQMSPLFQAVAEATEEAIYNSLLKARTVKGARGTAEALPIDKVKEILRKYNAAR